MQLTKAQKLLVHNILFHHTTLTHVDLSLRSEIEDIMLVIQDHLSDVESDRDDLDDDEVEEVYIDEDDEAYEDDNDDEKSDLDLFVNLPPLRCKDEDGNLGTLSFFRSKGRLCTDFEFDASVVSNYDLAKVVRGGKKISIITVDNETWEFGVSKFPKEWTSNLQANVSFEV